MPVRVMIWVKVFKNGPSKICGRQPLKNLMLYCLPKHMVSGMKLVNQKRTINRSENFRIFTFCNNSRLPVGRLLYNLAELETEYHKQLNITKYGIN